MPSRESDSTEPTEDNAGIPLSKRTRTQPPHPARKARAATMLRQKPVTEKKKDLEPPREKMPLKNSGISQEIWETRSDERHLRELLEERPDLFQALRSLVDGQSEGVTDHQRRELRRKLVVASDYSPLPWVKPILDAAFRQTPDGPCLVDPLDVRTPDEAARLEQVDTLLKQQRRERLVRIFKGQELEDDEKGTGGGRSI